MDKDEKERRRVLRQELKANECAEFEAPLPAPKADIRDLFDHLDTGDPCNNTLRGALEFIRARGLPEGEVVAWLERHGGHCDCEVIANVEDAWNQMVDEEWVRPYIDEEE